MTERPLALGLVGCGRLAGAWLPPCARRVPELRLVAVADPDPSAVSGIGDGIAGTASAGSPRIRTRSAARRRRASTCSSWRRPRTPTSPMRGAAAAAGGAGAGGEAAGRSTPPAPPGSPRSRPAPWVASTAGSTPAIEARCAAPCRRTGELDVGLAHRLPPPELAGARGARRRPRSTSGPTSSTGPSGSPASEVIEVRDGRTAHERATVGLALERGRAARERRPRTASTASSSRCRDRRCSGSRAPPGRRARSSAVTGRLGAAAPPSRSWPPSPASSRRSPPRCDGRRRRTELGTAADGLAVMRGHRRGPGERRRRAAQSVTVADAGQAR